MCSLKTCLTAETTYSVSLSVSSTGFAELLRTLPYDESSGTSESCLAYRLCVSAADVGVGEAEMPFTATPSFVEGRVDVASLRAR